MSCLGPQAARHYSHHHSSNLIRSHACGLSRRTTAVPTSLGIASLTGHAVHIPPSTTEQASATSAAWQSGPSPLATTLDPADQPGDGRRDPALTKHAGNTMQPSGAVSSGGCSGVTLCVRPDTILSSFPSCLCLGERPPLERACVLKGVQQDSRAERGPAVRPRTEEGGLGEAAQSPSSNRMELSPFHSSSLSEFRALPRCTKSTEATLASHQSQSPITFFSGVAS